VIQFTDTGAKVRTIFGSRISAPLAEIKVPQMTDTAFSALVQAWVTTVIALSLFVAALAFEHALDSGTYLQGLQDAFSFDI